MCQLGDTEYYICFDFQDHRSFRRLNLVLNGTLSPFCFLVWPALPGDNPAQDRCYVLQSFSRTMHIVGSQGSRLLIKSKGLSWK